MIYLPIDDFSSYSCYYVYDKDTIRVYDSLPQLNTSSNYTDYFLNSHYLTKSGSQTWGNYSQLPVCENVNKFTNDIYYRNDMPSILLMFLIFCIFCFYIPFKIVKSFFKKGV